LKSELQQRSDNINRLEVNNTTLRNELKSVRTDMEMAEQFNRRDNLIISGIPVTLSEIGGDGRRGAEHSMVTVNKILDLCKNHLDVEVSPSDISTAHRLKQKTDSNTVPPILVRFSRRLVRDSVFRAKSKLKTHNSDSAASSRIYVNEDLTDASRKLFGAARKLVHDKYLQGAWTSNCRVIVKSITGSISTIDNISQLHTMADEARRTSVLHT
jgi:hypothetical protein